MSEKRLDYIILSNNYYQIIQKDTDSCKRLAPTEIIRLLNSLNDENEQLKKKLEILEKIIADVETSVGMDITNLIDNDMCR